MQQSTIEPYNIIINIAAYDDVGVSMQWYTGTEFIEFRHIPNKSKEFTIFSYEY